MAAEHCRSDQKCWLCGWASALTTHCCAALGVTPCRRFRPHLRTQHCSTAATTFTTRVCPGRDAAPVAAGIPRFVANDQHRSACRMPACTWSVDEAERLYELEAFIIIIGFSIPRKCTKLGVTRHRSPVTSIDSLTMPSCCTHWTSHRSRTFSLWGTRSSVAMSATSSSLGLSWLVTGAVACGRSGRTGQVFPLISFQLDKMAYAVRLAS